MLQSLVQFIEQRLAAEGAGSVKAARFAELVGRLLASGVIWRDHSRPEATLYDDAVQCEQLLREWFGCIGFVLVHDTDARLLRLLPTSATERMALLRDLRKHRPVAYRLHLRRPASAASDAPPWPFHGSGVVQPQYVRGLTKVHRAWKLASRALTYWC